MNEIEEITDKKEIEQALPRVLDLIHLTYGDEYLGSTDKKHLVKTTKVIQVVKNANNEIIGGALCRRYLQSIKVSAFFSDKSKEGKIAVVSIIRKHIEEYKSLVWCETSGAIEHYYKKYNGYPIPNVYVAEILNKTPDEIELSENDNFHYFRIIGTDNVKKKVEKVIFGFPSQKLMDKFLFDAVYQSERKLFNTSKSVSESVFDDMPEDLYYAARFVERLSDLTEEGKILEMSPQLSGLLDNSIDVLKKYREKYEWVNDEYNVAEYLRNDIPIIPHGTMKEVIANLSTEYV